MKTLKIIIKWALISLGILLIAALIYVAIVAFRAKLAPQKLTSERNTLHIFDEEDNEVDLLGAGNRTEYRTLPNHTVGAFISVEDKRFFEHHGVDYRRIAGAAWHNLKKGNLGQGGSTITQQLIKNTHLTSAKTIDRKIREIKLAYDLERKYSKEQILEMYLNRIYFGNGLYGIQNAAGHYFSKDAALLNANESAWLAGIVKAPSFYSSPLNRQKSMDRKNLVLKLMQENGYLSEAELDILQAQELSIQTGGNDSLSSDYINQAILEAAELLRTEEREILSHELNLYTYCSASLQKAVSAHARNAKNEDYDIVALIIDNRTRGISSYYSSYAQSSTMRRQPGSVIKPILSYASALEENKIAPMTKVLDEPCSFGSYEPKNYKNSYEGYISIRRALEKSSNIVAVKTLEYAGIEAALAVSQRCGLTLDERDSSLAIALGGLTYGVTPLEMANAYATIGDCGRYSPPKHVRKLTDGDGNELYRDFKYNKTAIREDTAYLLTDILKGVSKTGTAKKLSSLPYEVAAKTGTVGFENGNTDAWAIGYTTEHTVAVWCGRPQGGLMASNVLGGTVPCSVLLETLNTLYSEDPPAKFECPDSVQKIAIDKLDYEQDNVIRLASQFTPSEYLLTDYFSMRNLPAAFSTRFTEPNVQEASLRLGSDGYPLLRFRTEPYLQYSVIRTDPAGRDSEIRRIENKSGILEIRDDVIPFSGIYEYSITISFVNGSTIEKRRSIGKVLVNPSAEQEEETDFLHRIFPILPRNR